MGKALWGRGKVVFSAPAKSKAVFTTNGLDFSTTLTKCGAELKADTGPASLTQVIALRAPINVPAGQRLIGYLQNLIFGVQRTPDVRVLIVADLAGMTKVIEFGYEDQTAPAQNDPLRVVRVFSPQGVETAGAGVLGLAAPIADYAATLTITIQRRTPSGHGSVQIDNLDVSAILTPPPA